MFGDPLISVALAMKKYNIPKRNCCLPKSQRGGGVGGGGGVKVFSHWLIGYIGSFNWLVWSC